MPPSPGLRFGRYELLAKLGAGGMGEVWRARDHDLQRDVAVKFLPERFASDPVRLGRFAQEARAASSLNHPNIVTIHEIGEIQGLPYLVMELVLGQTLREIVAGRPLSARRCLEIGAQLAEGLAKAHAAGIVHRDLKPDNVMVTHDRFVKILDFGLAKLRAEDPPTPASSEAPTWPGDSPSPQTAAGAVLGTAGYMSPEQARGRAVDYRSDQFALGAIFYEMATGQRAFQRETPAQTMAAIIERQPEPIASLNPACPVPLRWIVERCLAKDPAERYASTLDLARELRSVGTYLSDVGSGSATGPLAPARGFRPARRVAAGLAAVLVLGGGALATSPGLRERLAVELRLRALPQDKGIAVLPFTTTSQDPEDRLRSAGLAETLASRLSELERFHEKLWVVPEGEVRQAGVTSAEAARRTFGVRLVLSGSLQRLGDRLRLNAALVDARDRRQLRALGPADYRLDDLSLQDAMVEQVARMLELALGPQEQQTLRAGGTSVGGAYALYLQARGLLQRYAEVGSLERATSLFQQALQSDPHYALAYAGLGEAQWRLYRLNHKPERVDLARKACERALQENELLAPVHVTLGIIKAGTGHAEEALQDFDRALDLDPADADALREKGLALEALDRTKEAEATFRRATELRPGYWGNHSQLGAFYWRHGRYPEAEREFRKVVELAPDNLRGYANLGGLLHVAGHDDEAVAVLERGMALGPTYPLAANLAAVEFMRGRYAQAARAYERALGLDDRDYRVWRNLAVSYYWAPGERGRARAAYEHAARLAKDQLRVNPKDAGMLAQLADCHAALGEKESSRSELRRALALAPDDVEVLQTAAGAYAQLGDRDAALGCVRRALARGYPREQILRDPGLAQLASDPRFPQPPPAAPAALPGRRQTGS
jgi:eukaryotic-like serine/threonine-protein kinase